MEWCLISLENSSSIKSPLHQGDSGYKQISLICCGLCGNSYYNLKPRLLNKERTVNNVGNLIISKITHF